MALVVLGASEHCPYVRAAKCGFLGNLKYSAGNKDSVKMRPVLNPREVHQCRRPDLHETVRPQRGHRGGQGLIEQAGLPTNVEGDALVGGFQPVNVRHPQQAQPRNS